MAKKIKDLAVVTGTYTNSYGEEKRRYMNVGSLMEGDDGGQFITLSRYVNYGLLPSKGGDSLLISVFDLRERQDGGQQQRASTQQAGGGSAYDADLDDDSVPFVSCDPRRENRRKAVI